MTDLAYWNNSVIGEKGLVAVSSTDSSKWTGLAIVTDKTQFICEKGLGKILTTINQNRFHSLLS